MWVDIFLTNCLVAVIAVLWLYASSPYITTVSDRIAVLTIWCLVPTGLAAIWL